MNRSPGRGSIFNRRKKGQNSTGVDIWGMGLGAPGISTKWGILFFQRLGEEGDAWVVPSF